MVSISSIKPSDTIVFSGQDYKVRSILTYSDRVEVTYWDTNDHQPYTYERDMQVEVA